MGASLPTAVAVRCHPTAAGGPSHRALADRRYRLRQPPHTARRRRKLFGIAKAQPSWQGRALACTMVGLTAGSTSWWKGGRYMVRYIPAQAMAQRGAAGLHAGMPYLPIHRWCDV